MQFHKILIDWYSINKRILPWRETKDPYHIWLSEIILQQTQVKQGLPYYLAFVETYPTVFDLAKAQEADVLKLWQGLGYYSRARNLHSTAKYVADELHGVFPDNYKGLLKLKGVGDYTASAIASICFNEPTAVVDGNVYRVLSRYFGIDTPINSTQGIKEFKGLAQKLIDKKHPDTYNQAIMEFGARQCKPNSPDCGVCPLNDSCVALREHKINKLPVKIKKAKVKIRHFNFLVFKSNDGKTVLEVRKGSGIWQNLFQFPLLESTEEINSSEIRKLLDKHPLLEEKSFSLSLYNDHSIIHKLSHQHLHTKFWIIQVDSLNSGSIPIDRIHDYPVPRLLEKFIEEFNF